MKKLLVVAVAVLVSASAFAQKSMVRLDGCLADGRCDGADLYMDSNDAAGSSANATKETSFALNYAYLFTDNFGAGLKYVSKSDTKDGEAVTVGDKSSTLGLSFYWNLDGGWADSCYAALHYDMVTNDDLATADTGNKQTNITLEYGHRFALGTAWGLNLNYTPSVMYMMGTQSPNGTGDDTKTTALALNVANFAVVF